MYQCCSHDYFSGNTNFLLKMLIFIKKDCQKYLFKESLKQLHILQSTFFVQLTFFSFFFFSGFDFLSSVLFKRKFKKWISQYETFCDLLVCEEENVVWSTIVKINAVKVQERVDLHSPNRQSNRVPVISLLLKKAQNRAFFSIHFQ
jgi:hypothetical protein